MSGWKTKLAAIVSILYGLLGWLSDIHDIDVAMGFITQGIAFAGIGHKIEKSGPRITVVATHEAMSDEEFAEFVRRHQK